VRVKEGEVLQLLLSILSLMGRVLLESFSSWPFLMIFVLLFIIVVWQYKRLEEMSVIKPSPGRYLRSALISSLLGILGGVLGSLCLILIGIDLTNIAIMQLWLAALILMLINARFLCFAYAGGFLSLLYIFTGYPDLDVPQLMGLIAVLHMMESLLILANGSYNPLPVYVKIGGELRVGFNLQKFWPIPLVALMSSGMLADPGTSINMPDWWPLLKGYSAMAPAQNYVLLPVLAVLGYGEICTTSKPAQRVRKSAFNLLLFSITLLILAVLSSRWSPLLLITALFAPLGHEAVIWLGKLEESRGKALQIPAEPVTKYVIINDARFDRFLIRLWRRIKKH